MDSLEDMNFKEKGAVVDTQTTAQNAQQSSGIWFQEHEHVTRLRKIESSKLLA